MIPAKFKFLTDDNVLELQPSTSKTHHIYKYTKSITKLNQLLGLTEEEINKKISNKTISIL